MLGTDRLQGLKVYHLSTNSKIGGAGNAARRISNSLKEFGIDSILCAADGLDKSDIHLLARLRIYAARRIAVGIEQTLVKRLAQRGVYSSFGLLGSGIMIQLRDQQKCIVHLHWCAAGFVSLNGIARHNGPVVWTLHDRWPITRDLTHVPEISFSTEGRRDHGIINRLKKKVGYWIKEIVYRQKANAMANVEMVVCPSRWMLECTKRSGLVEDIKAIVIPNPVDKSFFRAKSRSAEKSIGLTMVVAGFRIDEDPNKGFDLLHEALIRVMSRPGVTDIKLIVIGACKQPRLGLSIEVETLQYIESTDRLAEFLSAADICIVPSRCENLCTVAMEAMACGTGVVAFDVGGMSDIVENGINGYLVEPFNIVKMSEVILSLYFNKEECCALGSNARLKAEQEWKPEVVANKYAELYSAIQMEGRVY